MKTFTLSSLALMFMFGTASAHDIHTTASDHHHPGPVYTHSVSSHVNHHETHHYNRQSNHQNHNQKVQKAYRPSVAKSATYYTRQYPIKKNYTYYTPANTTIHQPPYAYSSCAGSCNNQPKRMMVSSTIGSRSQTYRAPSEYKASCALNYLPTPRKVTSGCRNNTPTYTSSFSTHKVPTWGGCGY